MKKTVTMILVILSIVCFATTAMADRGGSVTLGTAEVRSTKMTR